MANSDGAMILRSSQWPLPYPEAQPEFFERRINGHGENMVKTLGEMGKPWQDLGNMDGIALCRYVFFDDVSGVYGHKRDSDD